MLLLMLARPELSIKLTTSTLFMAMMLSRTMCKAYTMPSRRRDLPRRGLRSTTNDQTVR